MSAARQMLGIELNPFAVELARASVWIGELQWWRRHGLTNQWRSPVLEKLDTIERRDALLNEDGAQATGPRLRSSSATHRSWAAIR